MLKHLAYLIKIALTFYALLLTIAFVFQRKLIYYPSHHTKTNGLAEWMIDGRLAGYARKVNNPLNVWLFIHGNAGQAADRVYALPCFSAADSVYILEYPGYGRRKGSPGMDSFNSAAAEAYIRLRKEYPDTPVCVFGESIGGGPASSLARQAKPPDRIVLVAPFDDMASVVRDHFPLMPAGLLLLDRWDNVAALRGYAGKVEIYGAVNDHVIPIRHARALAGSIPGAVFHEISGGHNDWPQWGSVKIRN